MTQAANLAALGTNAGTTGILPAAGGGTAGTAGVTGFKNRIINGNMIISQRNGTTATSQTNGTYNLDRWQGVSYTGGATTGKYTVAQSSTAATGFVNSLLVTSSAATSTSATDIYALLQIIEGYNIADLGWGTSNGKTVTLSFWVRSSATGTFGGNIRNQNSDWSYPFTYTISAANTFEYKTITIPAPTAGSTWQTDNSQGIYIFFNLQIGSNFTLSATGSWQNANAYGASGCVNLLNNSGATFYVTGVQLEVGTTATNFDFRSIGTELNLCLRYCVKYVAGAGEAMGAASTWTSSSFWIPGRTPLPMRAAPSASVSTGTTYYSVYFAGSAFSNNSLDFTWTSDGSGNNQGFLLFNSSGWTGTTSAGLGGGAQTNAPGAKIIISAEL